MKKYLCTTALALLVAPSALGEPPSGVQSGVPARAASVKEKFMEFDARVEANTSAIEELSDTVSTLGDEVACEVLSLAGWWTFSQTDGKYSLVCIAYMDEAGIAEADVAECTVADRGSDDDHYVVTDTIFTVSPSISAGSWTASEEVYGCSVSISFTESRGITTMEANVGRHGDSLAGWGRYPTGDLFGVTGIRTSKNR